MQDDRRRVRQVAGADVDHHDGQAVVVEALDLEVARLQPPLDEARGSPQAIQRRRVIGDQPLGEDAFVHPAQAIERAGRSAPRSRVAPWRAASCCSEPPATPGELTARELAGIGERPVLAARDGARVRALADELGGLEWAVADVGRPESVRALVERGDVLVSCVGPFARWGAPAVEAAIDAGAHYLDSTGETPFIRRIFEQLGPARRGGRLRAADGDGLRLGAGQPRGRAGADRGDAGDAATRVAVGYFLRGAAGMSGGTRASAAGVFLEPSFAWRGGRIVTERGGARGRSFLVDGRTRKAISAGSSEHFGAAAVVSRAAGGRRLPRLVRWRVGRAARGLARPLGRHARPAGPWRARRGRSAAPSRAAPAGRTPRRAPRRAR